MNLIGVGYGRLILDPTVIAMRLPLRGSVLALHCGLGTGAAAVVLAASMIRPGPRHDELLLTCRRTLKTKQLPTPRNESR